MKKWQNGVYLIDGRKIVKKGEEAACPELARFSSDEISRADTQTISYSILAAHNVSDNMARLRIKFDALVGQDMTYMGVLETAIASGVKEFPLPFVLSSCH
ncbi:MAG: hydratase, partial [Pygmaiobacter massiliensis]|nr:hydratase [Pygmaiobacter massiliensis]